MTHTLVAMFDDRAGAERAREKLISLGFDHDDLTLQAADGASAGGTTTTTTSSSHHEGGIGGWFRSLFGLDDDDETVRMHGEAYRRGATMLSVDARDEVQADRAADVLNECGAIDLDDRANQWRSEGWMGAGTDTTAGTLGAAGTTSLAAGAATPAVSARSDAERHQRGPTSIASGEDIPSVPLEAQRATLAAGASGETSQTLPIIEEQLAIGKRAVRRGAIRVYTRVVETPVEETVRLREEHAEIVRRDVDRPATEADFRAMKDGTIELNETAEEAVIEKRARVTGEVEVGKRVTERAETVRDTVRRTEVEVDEHAMAKRDETGVDRDVKPTGRKS
ncbi:MAG TPA: YsnF/AvaK domain-containing protein [Burkholderiaceae bacterium]|nr:YsnF/AvaK domain-containing protein [Burkholderiaceae bacterium]